MTGQSNGTRRGVLTASLCALLACALFVVAIPATMIPPNALAAEPNSPASASLAPSLPITDSALHTRNAEERYRTGALLYETLALSGSGFGRELFPTTQELESLTTPGLYEQGYGFADGSTHRYTGLPLVDMLEHQGATITDATTVRIEAADGSAYITNGAEMRSTSTATPALLAFGCDGVPNTEGAFSVVLGQSAATNGSSVITQVTRIAVGQDIDYMQHVYAPYDNSRYVTGAKDVVVRIYRGNKMVRESSFSYLDIEAMARADRAGIQRGYYSALVYGKDEYEHSGPFTDYYEGYELYKILQAAGVPGNAPDAKVQFYQTADYGVENSWKTVNVSLGYLAGNGPSGIGDYSQNVSYYGRDETTNTGGVALWDVRPVIAYGKNGLPLMYTNGSPGVTSTAHNYRGPLIALLPQNAAEGGRYVGNDSVAACFLGLIDVYLDDYGSDMEAAPIATQDKSLAALLTEGDGVSHGQTVKTKVITPTDGAISVESSDPNVATATYDTVTGELAVTAVGSGSCTVRVRAAAGVNYLASEVHEIPVCVMDVEFLGGSLRVDQFKPDGTPEDSVASMRLGYRIEAPQGVGDLSWHWTFDTDDDPDDSGYTCLGRYCVAQEDGSIVTNLVFTSIPTGHFATPLYARLVVTGTDTDGNAFAWRDEVRSRSVQQIAGVVFE